VRRPAPAGTRVRRTGQRSGRRGLGNRCSLLRSRSSLLAQQPNRRQARQRARPRRGQGLLAPRRHRLHQPKPAAHALRDPGGIRAVGGRATVPRRQPFYRTATTCRRSMTEVNARPRLVSDGAHGYHGFTLVEVMVALTGALFLSISVFLVAKHTT